MSITELMGAVGVAIQGTLALLMAVVWRSLRMRWTLLLAGGFCAVTLQYLNVALGHTGGAAAWSTPPVTWNAVFALLAHGLITWALVDYLEIPPRAARRLREITSTIVCVTLLALAAGVLSRAVTVAVISLFLCSWAVLFGWAMRREPDTGHGILMLAVLTYPLAMTAAALGWLSVSGAGLSLIVPHAVMGMTLLTTGLVRAQAAAVRALAARAQAQAELERINQTLEHRVAQRTAQLRETIDGLESFNRSVSHDLRGPLGGITGVARLARDALARGDLADTDRLLAAIARQSESSTDLVAALLQLARAGDAAVERRAVDTGALVREVVEEVTRTTSVAPVIRVEPTLPSLLADPALLRQVFANLLGNGVKFSARAAAPLVEIGATRTAQGVVIHVRDNGVGFSDSQASDLFRPFRRLHADRFAGHGVGLTIVRRIVERHGGRLWAEGRPGEGATFFFTLE